MPEDTYMAVFTQNPGLYQRLADIIQGLGFRVAQFSYGDRLDALQRWSDDSTLIALFDGSQQPEACLRWIKWLTEDRPNTVSVWLDSELKQEHVAEAMRAGARDLLIGEFKSEDVEAMVKRLAFHRMECRGSSSVVAVAAGAGGSGGSTLVANMAVEIAKHEKVSVGVLDLNPYVSGVGLLLNLRPDATLFDLWQKAGDLDTSLIKRVASTHQSGVSLVTSQGWSAEQLPIPEQLIRRVILLMQQLFPFILIDLPRGVCLVSRMVVDTTEAVLLVGSYSMAAAAGLRQMQQHLEALEYPKHRVLLVANSVSEPLGLSHKQWTQCMSREPFARVPFDPGPVNQAAAEGVSLAEVSARAPVTKSVQKLAQNLCNFLHRQPDNSRGSVISSSDSKLRRVAALSK